MVRQFSLFLLLMYFLFSGCSSSKKNTASQQKSPDNPTLDKADYVWLNKETFQISETTTDTTYGYSPKNAIKVGGGSSGPFNERAFLNALLGPQGQKVTYRRLGGCCAVESKNGFMGLAMLDKYEVNYDGLNKPIILYINMYDPGKLFAPVGFTYKK